MFSPNRHTNVAIPVDGKKGKAKRPPSERTEDLLRKWPHEENVHRALMWVPMGSIPPDSVMTSENFLWMEQVCFPLLGTSFECGDSSHTACRQWLTSKCRWGSTYSGSNPGTWSRINPELYLVLL